MMKCVCVLLPDGFSNPRHPQEKLWGSFMILFDVVEFDFPPTLIFCFHTTSSSCVRHAPLSISTSTGFSDGVPFGEKTTKQHASFGLFFDFPSHLRCCLVCQKEKCESNKQPVHWTSFCCCCCFVIFFYRDTFGSMDCDEFVRLLHP